MLGMIQLTQAQKETLLALFQVVGVGPNMATAVDNISHQRVKLRSDVGRKEAAVPRTTKAVLESLEAIVPRLVESSGNMWKLTLAGHTVANVQLRVVKATQPSGAIRESLVATKGTGSRSRRNNTAR